MRTRPATARPNAAGSATFAARLLAVALGSLLIASPAWSRGATAAGRAIGSPGAAPEVEPRAGTMALDVPVVLQQRERCGQAALQMVLGYYGATATQLHEVDGAYDPVLRGSLITDLASAARRAGFDAVVATLTAEELIGLLDDGVPPILLYQSGSRLATFGHYGVVTGWDAGSASFTLHDGTARPLVTRRQDLEKRWRTAGSQTLIVRRRLP